MVIVHRNKITVPTGGHTEPRMEIEMKTEYISSIQKFRIDLPDFMWERVGAKYVQGDTANEASHEFSNACGAFTDSFIIPNQVKKVIKYSFDITGRDYQGIFDHKIYIDLRWGIEHYCRLVQDPPDAKWIECDENGKIASSQDIRFRIDLDKEGFEDVFMDWTPEREEFFRNLIAGFNNMKHKMIDFFHPMKREEMLAFIDSGARALPMIGKVGE